jgi:hypothetical protein
MRLDDLRYLDPRSEIVRTENRLPHWQQPGVPCFITFHLADAVPIHLLRGWKMERDAWLRHHPEPWTPENEQEYHRRFPGQIERWLDAGHGSSALRDPRCSQIVGGALGFFEGTRSTQLSWIVMPNHVHTLFVLHESWTLEEILHSWKRHSSRQINLLRHSTGTLWQKDYFDRLIRDRDHLINCVRYIRRNPVKARLHPSEYLLWESELARSIE